MPDVTFPDDVIVVPVATVVGGNTNPGVVMASPDEFIDMAEIGSLHVQIDLLSFDRGFTVSGGSGEFPPRSPATGYPVMLSFVTGMERDPHAMGGGNSVMAGSLDATGPVSPGFLKVPAAQEEAIARYVAWQVMNFSTSEPAVVRLRGIARR